MRPYGKAFDLVGHILAVDAAAGRIAAQHTYSDGSEAIAAHSEAAGPIVPGVFLIEQAAQTVLAFARETGTIPLGTRPRLVNVRAEWVAPAPLGVPILASVEIGAGPHGVSSFRAVLSHGGEQVAKVRGLVAFTSEDANDV